MTDQPPMVTRGAATGATIGGVAVTAISTDLGAVLYHRFIHGVWPEEISGAVQSLIGSAALTIAGLVVALVYWRLAIRGFTWPEWLRSMSMFGKRKEGAE